MCVCVCVCTHTRVRTSMRLKGRQRKAHLELGSECQAHNCPPCGASVSPTCGHADRRPGLTYIHYWYYEWNRTDENLRYSSVLCGGLSEVLAAQSCLTICDPMDSSPPRLLCPWNSAGKDAGVGNHSLLQGIFPTQGSKPGLLLCRQTLYRLSH